jgi:predicted negative regulator of RcsB-dependent stress response
MIQLGDLYAEVSLDSTAGKVRRELGLINYTNIKFSIGMKDEADSLYKQFVLDFPKSEFAPYALMRQAEKLESENKIKEAEAILKEIVLVYPESEHALDAKVTLEKKLLGKSEEEKFNIIVGK